MRWEAIQAKEDGGMVGQAYLCSKADHKNVLELKMHTSKRGDKASIHSLNVLGK
jgi:hypothetical protein